MNSDSQPLVSVVTPVYNEEEHLAECIESVLAQTYQKWDYTIVNNCSTDRSLEIARRYATKDQRIRVISNERFLSMLANHNLALRQISPECKYCKMVLGDDWIFPECLERMVAVAEANPSAGVISSYQLHGDQVRSTGLPLGQTLVSGYEASRQFLLQKLVLFGTQNSVLYRADLVRARGPFYIETDVCADFEVCLALLKTCDLGFVHQVLSFSRVRPESTGAITWDSGAYFGSLLGILQTYGKDCLSDGEFRTCLELQLSQYYRFLGRRIWVERNRAFWAFHRTTLTNAGVGLGLSSIGRAALRELYRSVLDPKAVIERLRRLSLLRRIRSQQSRRALQQFEPNQGGAEIADR
jgi:glycosyltransferase involved in cell wall biosynthesis